MSLAGTLSTLFGSQDLYGILGVDAKASENDIKRAYRRMALTYHPDKHVYVCMYVCMYVFRISMMMNSACYFCCCYAPAITSIMYSAMI